MVCDSCVKKLGKIATIDPYRTKSRNEGAGSIRKGANENKLLSSKKDRNFDITRNLNFERPVIRLQMPPRANCAIFGVGEGGVGFQPYSQEFRRCRICKTVVHQVGSHYCQQCAYQKAICAMCGKKMAETKKLKMSSV